MDRRSSESSIKLSLKCGEGLSCGIDTLLIEFGLTGCAGGVCTLDGGCALRLFGSVVPDKEHSQKDQKADY